jgi:glutaminyl-peptide cyclotransferase
MTNPNNNNKNRNVNIRQRKKLQQQQQHQADDHDVTVDNGHDTSLVRKRSRGKPAAARHSGFDAAFMGIAGLLLALLLFTVLVIFSTPSDKQSATSTTTSTTTTATTSSSTTSKRVTQMISDYTVVRKIPHDPLAFTQGLTFRPDDTTILYEATGLYNQSTIRILDLQQPDENVAPRRMQKLEARYFGEGLSYFDFGSDNNDNDNDNNNNKGLIHLTWREQTAFILDIDTLDIIQQFFFQTTTQEGWGITHVPHNQKDNPSFDFIVTDGSFHLHFWDQQFQPCQPTVQVTYQTRDMMHRDMPPKPLGYLNELEWDSHSQTLLANIWGQDYLARIDTTTGFVLALYDLQSLYPNRDPTADVLNGIALHPVNGQLWVTGKNWPFLYQIELGPWENDVQEK